MAYPPMPPRNETRGTARSGRHAPAAPISADGLATGAAPRGRPRHGSTLAAMDHEQIDVAGRMRFAAGNRLPTRAVRAPPSRRKWSGSWMQLVCTLAEPASRSANGCGPCWDGCEKSRMLIDHVVRPTGYRGGYHRQILAGCFIGRDGHDSDCSQPIRLVMEVGVPRGGRIAVVHGRLVVLLLAGVEGCDAQLALHEPVGITCRRRSVPVLSLGPSAKQMIHL